METKPVKESKVEIVQQMTHQDANLLGNVHGGVILKYIDNTAALVACKHSQKNCVTASVDRVDFHHPVYIGDIIHVMASINYTGKTSMEVGVRVEAENFITGERRHTSSAYLTMVALVKGHPSSIPPAIFETENEKRRNRDALDRREIRLKTRKKSS